MEKEKDLRYRTWCRLYKEKFGINYLKDTASIKNLKYCELSLEEFELYAKKFLETKSWWSTPKTLKNMLSRINEIQLLLTQKEEVKPLTESKKSFPDYWSEKFASKLSVEELESYYEHLRNLGYKPIKVVQTGIGSKTKWVKSK